MRLLSPDHLTRAILLAAIAGIVDVVAFLALGGFFASFMSGNTTRLAIGLNANWYDAQLAAALIAAFVLGVFGTAMLRARRAGRAEFITLAVMAVLLALAALFADPNRWWPMWLLAAAMGSANTLFEAGGEIRVGVTYMSGTLVKIGQGLADWMGRRATTGAWQRPLLMWCAFFGGGMIGVGLYARWGLPTLWVPAAASALLAGLAWRSGTAAAEEQPGSGQD